MVNLAHVRTGLHRNRFQNKLQGRRAENLLFHMICLLKKYEFNSWVTSPICRAWEKKATVMGWWRAVACCRGWLRCCRVS